MGTVILRQSRIIWFMLIQLPKFHQSQKYINMKAKTVKLLVVNFYLLAAI